MANQVITSFCFSTELKHLFITRRDRKEQSTLTKYSTLTFKVEKVINVEGYCVNITYTKDKQNIIAFWSGIGTTYNFDLEVLGVVNHQFEHVSLTSIVREYDIHTSDGCDLLTLDNKRYEIRYTNKVEYYMGDGLMSVTRSGDCLFITSGDNTICANFIKKEYSVIENKCLIYYNNSVIDLDTLQHNPGIIGKKLKSKVLKEL